MFFIFCKICLGTVLGYWGASIMESVIHRYVLHAPLSFRNFWAKHPQFFKPFIREFYIHHIHHAHTFKKDHVTQFSDETEQQYLDSHLNLNNGEWANHIRKTGYGLFAQVRGLLYVAIFTTFIFTIPYYLIFGFWVCLGSIPPLYFLSYFMSRFVHPVTHISYQNAAKHNSGVFKLLLTTRYFRRIIRYHFLHHRHNHCNYNLALGADSLFGWAREINEEDENEMQKIGIRID